MKKTQKKTTSRKKKTAPRRRRLDTSLDILVILDRSGSMASSRTDHEGGLKALVKKQQAEKGTVRFSLIQFDSGNPCEVLYDRTPIADVGAIKLNPRGSTPLFDAIGLATTKLAEHKPANVLCVIVTDGEENASRTWTKDQVKARVEELETKGWTFTFLGANIDAFAAGHAVGVNFAQTMQFNNARPAAVGSTYDIMADKITKVGASIRAAKRPLTRAFRAAAMAFSEDERSRTR